MAQPAPGRSANWSTPTWPAAPSTISSATTSRRSSGASFRARARPAASNRWRCASSASANSKSKSSRPRNTGPSTPLLKTPPGDTLTARLVKLERRKARQVLAAERSRRARRARRDRSRQVRGRPASNRNPRAAIRRRPSRPRPCSKRPRASSASPPAHTMRVAQRLYEGVDIGGETVGLITYMRTDGVDVAPEAIAANAQADRHALSPAPCARQPARLQVQGRATRRKRTKPSARPTSSARREVARTARARHGAALRAWSGSA